MKKIIFMLVMASSITMYAEEIKEIATQENEKPTEAQLIIKEVSGENMQQLDVKDIDTEELILQNQNLESSSVKISGENLKENGDKVVVKQENTVNLEEELSQGVEKKGWFRRMLDKLFN